MVIVIQSSLLSINLLAQTAENGSDGGKKRKWFSAFFCSKSASRLGTFNADSRQAV